MGGSEGDDGGSCNFRIDAYVRYMSPVSQLKVTDVGDVCGDRYLKINLRAHYLLEFRTRSGEFARCKGIPFVITTSTFLALFKK